MTTDTKLHWTQTPEGKRKMKKIRKKAAITRAANSKSSEATNSSFSVKTLPTEAALVVNHHKAIALELAQRLWRLLTPDEKIRAMSSNKEIAGR